MLLYYSCFMSCAGFMRNGWIKSDVGTDMHASTLQGSMSDVGIESSKMARLVDIGVSKNHAVYDLHK